jgi:hypothetical protein
MEDEEEFDFTNYLIATIRIPVKVKLDGKLSVLNDYVKIEIEKMNSFPKKSNDSIYNKIVEYVDKNPEYLEIIANTHNDEGGTKEDDKETKEGSKEEDEGTKEEDKGSNEGTKEEDKETNEGTKEEDKGTKEEDKGTNEEASILHNFPYFNKSKQPLNITFRAKVKAQNFTKKIYQ